MTLFEGNELLPIADRLGASFITRDERLYAPSWWNVIVISADYTATYGDVTFACDTNAGNVTVTLPSAADSFGKVYAVKKTKAANVLRLKAAGGDAIDGAGGKSTSAQWASFGVISDGATWNVLFTNGAIISDITYTESGALWALLWFGAGNGIPGIQRNKLRSMGRGKLYLHGQSFGGL